MTKLYRILGKRGRITIPYEIRKRVGFSCNDVLSFAEQDDRTVIVRREKLCNDCRNVPGAPIKPQPGASRFWIFWTAFLPRSREQRSSICRCAGRSSKAVNPMSKILRVVMVEPHEAPYELNITDQLENLQETVGGMIEVIGNGDGTLLITPKMLPYGTGYSIVEVQAPHGYVLNPEPVYFDVTAENAESADGITLVIAEKSNIPQKGKIQIVKTGEVFASVTEKDGRYTPVYGESGLAGAEFEIRAAEDVFTPDGTLRYAKGDVVDTLTTTADGTAESRELYLGKYEIQETKAPYGMVRDDSILTAELVYASQEISVTSTSVAVYNERQKVEVKLYKDLEKDELFQIGSGDEILHVYFALYAAEELTAADGSMIPADGLIEIAGVQADGTLVFASDLPIGSYYVKEYAVDAQYLISEETYPIAFTYEDDTTAVVRIEVNNGEAILNRIIRGSITGIKVDEQGEPLPGAVFGLFRADCTAFTEENALLTAESAEDGSFSFENIPYGVWLVREIAAPEGYVLSDEIFTVQVSENGAVIEIENLENKPITGELELTKKDISDGKLLPGAGFRIKDADGNVVVEGYTDENGIAKFTLRYGKYTYQEKWVCQSCGMAIKITDADLLRAITDQLNDLLADPEQVHYTPAANEPPLELLRMKNEIGRMLDGSMIDKELLKNKIFEYAAQRYAELDADGRITMEIRAALSDTGPLSSYSAELTKAIVTAITLHADKSVTLTLKNGQQVRKERSDGAHEHSA